MNFNIQLAFIFIALLAIALFRFEIIPFKLFGALFALPMAAWLITAIVVILKMGLLLFKGNSFQLSDVPSLVLSVLIIGLVVLFFQAAKSYPMIHDISTDTNEPPEFRSLLALRDKDDNSLDYDPSISVLQHKAYPFIKPLTTKLSAEKSLAIAKKIAENLEWQIVKVNAEGDTIESIYKSQVFGFIDDIIIRVRDNGDNTIIDLRSVSRVGKGDFGANAKRIKDFMTEFAKIENN